jgi:hypothetical protein
MLSRQTVKGGLRKEICRFTNIPPELRIGYFNGSPAFQKEEIRDTLNSQFTEFQKKIMGF